MNFFFIIFRDEVRDVGETIGVHVNKKHYLHATELLVTSLKRLDTDLKMVEALKEVHTDLSFRKEVSSLCTIRRKIS